VLIIIGTEVNVRTHCCKNWELRSLLECIVATVGTEFIVGSRQRSWVTLSKQWPWIGCLWHHCRSWYPFQRVIYVHSFFKPWLSTLQLSNPLTSPLVIWREEHISNFSVLQSCSLLSWPSHQSPVCGNWVRNEKVKLTLVLEKLCSA
jgi:hypothetical protein